jgi:hypothetical protein
MFEPGKHYQITEIQNGRRKRCNVEVLRWQSPYLEVRKLGQDAPLILNAASTHFHSAKGIDAPQFAEPKA